MPEEYMAEYLSFPEDIQDSRQGHHMMITAVGHGSENSILSTVTLFIPGGINGSNMVWETTHEYVDKKMGYIGPGALGAVGGLLQTAAGMTGGAINSKVEILYRDTALRRFQFSFIMSPQSDKESQSLRNIVQTLRRYSSPNLYNATSDPQAGYIGTAEGQFEFLSTGGLYQSPSEFIIKFYYIDEYGQILQNLNIPRIGRCVLTGIDINYTPTGEWSTFKDGNPISAMLTMAFMEMRVINQQNVQDGY
jgi:hypothetical protein